MKYFFILILILIFSGNQLFGQDTVVKARKKTQKSFLVENRPWTIEIPLWIPGFRGDFAFGDIKIEGGDGEDPGDPGDDDEDNIFGKIFSKNWFLKFFFLTRVAYENKGFLVQFDGISGGVGESVKFNYNNKEIVKLELATINLRLLAGYRIVNVLSTRENFRYELYGYLGTRYHNHKIYSEYNGQKDILDLRPGWFEPIIGVQNQFSFKRWFIVAQGDYGGLFIDNKYSFQFSTFAYYRTGRALSLKFGWSVLDLNHRSTHLGKDLKIGVTLSGPSIGLVIHF